MRALALGALALGGRAWLQCWYLTALLHSVSLAAGLLAQVGLPHMASLPLPGVLQLLLVALYGRLLVRADLQLHLQPTQPHSMELLDLLCLGLPLMQLNILLLELKVALRQLILYTFGGEYIIFCLLNIS